MKDKIVIATIASNGQYYYMCAKNLLNNFVDDDDFILYVYTDNENEFIEYKNVNLITHEHSTNFKFHDKFIFINEIRKLGHQKICYIDADLYLADKTFIQNIKSYKFNAGLTCTRYTNIEFKSLLSTNKTLEKFKLELDKAGVFYKNAMTPWEDLLFFDFTYFASEKIDLFFESFAKFRKMREKHADISKDDLRGEGAVFGLTSVNEEFPINASNFLFKQLQYFKDNHFPNYEDIEGIYTESDYIILVKKEENYEKILEITINFYKQHFKNIKYIVIEINDEETLKDVVEKDYSSEYVFFKTNENKTTHEAIIKSLKISDKKVFTFIENGAILLEVKNVQNNIESILRGLYDFIVPFNKTYESSYLKLTKNNISSIFICNKNLFLNEFEIKPWKNEQDIHEKLANNYNSKITPNDLIILNNNNPKLTDK